MIRSFWSISSTLLVAIFYAQGLYAQSNTEEADLMQSLFGMEKKAVVADFLDLESDNPFWAIYDEYEARRKDLGKERLAVLRDYLENYDGLTNDKYDELIAGTMSLRTRTDKLMDQYYRKIRKASGPKVAAQFFQFESYVLLQIRTAIFEGIPFIGASGN